MFAMSKALTSITFMAIKHALRSRMNFRINMCLNLTFIATLINIYGKKYTYSTHFARFYKRKELKVVPLGLEPRTPLA